MLQPYDTYENLSVQDYGPWLDRLSLYEVNGKIYLKEEFGYSKPYDKNWYKLSERPTKTLKDAFCEWTNGGFCGGAPVILEDELAVSLTACESPWGVGPLA